MAFVDGLPADATPSLLRDVAAGRPSEIEALCGAVVRHGAQRGVATPVHCTILSALLPQDMQRRALEDLPPTRVQRLPCV